MTLTSLVASSGYTRCVFAVPVGGVEAREGILDAVCAQHIGNLAEQAVPVVSNLGHVYTLTKTRPP